MVTPAPVPVNPVTSDPDLERLRSSPFPHYDPEQHPWAPSPPSQVNEHPHTNVVTISKGSYVCMHIIMYVHMYTRVYVHMYVHHSCGCIH